MVDDGFHLRVFLFSEIFLGQASPLTLVRLPRALGVYGEERRHLLHLAAAARRTRPFDGKSGLGRHHELFEPVGTHITDILVDRHARNRCRGRARFAWMLVLLLAPALLSAQGADKKNPLADIRMLKCSFPVSATGSWK